MILPLRKAETTSALGPVWFTTLPGALQAQSLGILRVFVE